MTGRERIGILTIVRNLSGGVALFRKRLMALQWNPERVMVAVVENDSEDDTLGHLLDWSREDSRLLVATYNDRSPKGEEDIEGETRYRTRARAKNYGLAMLRTLEPDYILAIEADLLFGPDLLTALVERIEKLREPSVLAPLVVRSGDDETRAIEKKGFPIIDEKGDVVAYDTWGFRAPGQGPHQPWPPQGRDGFVSMDSVGSCILFPAQPVLSFQPEDEIVGLCREARAKGMGVWYTSEVMVVHPWPPVPSVAALAPPEPEAK